MGRLSVRLVVSHVAVALVGGDAKPVVTVVTTPAARALGAKAGALVGVAAAELGGRGGGKSRSIASALVLRAAQKPLRILCASEIQTSFKDSVKRLLDDETLALLLTFPKPEEVEA